MGPLRITLQVGCAALLATLLVSRAEAAPHLELVAPAGGEVRLSGVVDDRQTSLARTVTVVLRDAPSPLRASFHAGPLSGANARGERVVIDGSNATVPDGGATLTPDQETDVRITIAGLRQPGEYRGTARLLLPGPDGRGGVALQLVAQPQTVPLLSAPRPMFAAQLVRCWPGECALARFLQPTLARDGDLPLLVRNVGDDKLTIEDVLLLIHGERTGRPLGAALTVSVPTGAAADLAPGKVSEISVKATAASAEPDRYSGEIVIGAKGGLPELPRRETTLKAQVDVRAGPLLPILLIFVGVVLGRLFRMVEAPEVTALAQQVVLLEEIRKEIRTLRAGALSKPFEIAAAAADRQLSRGDPESAKSLQKLRKAVDLAHDAEALEGALDQADRATFAPEFEKVREVLAVLDVDAAAASLEDLRKKAASRKGRAIPLPLPIARSPAPGLRVEPAKGCRERLSTLLLWATGMKNVSGEAALFLKQFFFGVLLLALILIGLQTFWVNAASFGAQGLLDYAGLMLWGVSADVAQRTLQGAQLKT
jgi:hypothetical protein